MDIQDHPGHSGHANLHPAKLQSPFDYEGQAQPEEDNTTLSLEALQALEDLGGGGED